MNLAAKQLIRLAAALAAVALVGAACGSEPGESASQGSIAPQSAPSGLNQPGPVSTGELDTARQVAIDFVDALGAGDIDAAASLVGPVSEERADQAGGLESMLRQSTEGHGAWAEADDREATPIGIAAGLVAVTFEGTLQVEGSAEHRIEVFPVRKAESADAWLIEPWAYDLSGDRPFEIVSPAIDDEERANVDPTQPIAVEVQASEAGTVSASFDGHAPTSAEVMAGEPVTLMSPGGGAELVVVVYQSGPTLVGQGFRAVGGETPPAAAVVDRYIAAIAGGDLEAAWDLVAEPSRQALGGFEEFEALRTALSEGIGAWSVAEDRQVFVLPVEGAGEAWAVTLMGTVPLEGPPSLAATSLIVYTTCDEAKVSPFENVLGDSGFVLFDPPPGAELAPGERLLVEVPDGVGTTAAFIDDGAAELRAVDEGRPLPRLEVVPEDLPGQGPHATTIVVGADDGRLTAIAAAHKHSDPPPGDS